MLALISRLIRSCPPSTRSADGTNGNRFPTNRLGITLSEFPPLRTQETWSHLVTEILLVGSELQEADNTTLLPTPTPTTTARAIPTFTIQFLTPSTCLSGITSTWATAETKETYSSTCSSEMPPTQRISRLLTTISPRTSKFR